jgi:hypothetical protein
MKQFRKTWLYAFVLSLGLPMTSSAMASHVPPYELGDLPEGFAVNWPKGPRRDRVVQVATAEEFNIAASTPRTKIGVTADIPSGVYISASDIDVRMVEGVVVHGLTIGKGLQRIRVRGGRFGAGGINMSYPTEYLPTRITKPEWQIEDVLFDGIEVNADAGHSALNLRGHRVAVINSHLRGGEYAIWSDTTLPLVNSDVIIAGNTLQSEGDQAVLRLVGVYNSVTVDNRIENLLLTGRKHAYRVHGESDQVFAARNTLVNGGTMFGTMPHDMIGEIWFEDSSLHHTTEDLFHPEAGRVLRLHAHGNKAYSARSCFLCFAAPSEWDVADNELFPYEPPPAQ